MGQKVNPHGLRIGIIKDWDTKWYANKKNFYTLSVCYFNKVIVWSNL
jgi:small subunit ribosomal protein S3